MRAFLFLILELAIVHQPSHRGLSHGGNLDKIHIRFFSHAQGFAGGDNSEGLILNAHQAQFGHVDLAIQAVRPFAFGRSDAGFSGVRGQKQGL